MKHILAALLLGTASSAFAAAPTGPIGPDTLATLRTSPNVTHTKAMSVAVYPNPDHTKMHLMIENHVEVPLYISFWDGDQQLYHVKVGRRTRVFHTKFNVSGLKDGEYTIEVSDGYHKIQKAFQLGTRPPQKSEPSRLLTTLD